MSFTKLPRELQLRIFLYATQPPHGSLGQAPTLALVSRVAYSIMTELLFKHVRVTSVTTLRRIHAGLQANPAPGELAQSIHIGPDEVLPFRGWPLLLKEVPNGDGPIDLFLRSTLPESLLPRWAKADCAFNVDKPNSKSCHHYALILAMATAVKGFDVDPHKRGWTLHFPARRIGIRAWALRLWEVQAVLDLFLIDMRKREDKGLPAIELLSLRRKPASTSSDLPPECNMGICGHYPILELTKRSRVGFSEDSDAAQKYLYLPKEDLWRHLASTRGPAEHFDHLILFARSGRGNLGMGQGEWHALRDDLKGPHQAWFNDGDGEDDDDAVSISSDEADWGAEEPDSQSPSTTVGKGEELLALARGVLARTPRITNLSLSSFFHKALSGCTNTDSLISLTLGPIVPWWSHILLPISSSSNLDQDKQEETDLLDHRTFSESKDGEKTMSRLESLRICGMITNRDARKIAMQLPSLRDVTLEITNEYGSHVIEVVEALQSQSDQLALSQHRPRRYTEVRLSPEAMESSRVPIPTAWLENRHVDGTLHPVKVKLSKNVVAHDPPQWEDEEQTMDAQYAEARDWWKQGLVGVGMYSELE